MIRLKSKEERDLDRENFEGEYTFCEDCYSCRIQCKRTTKEMYEKDAQKEILRQFKELEEENKKLKARIIELEEELEGASYE